MIVNFQDFDKIDDDTKYFCCIFMDSTFLKLALQK